jgi:nucleotide-binding universal stress UspA family protein
MGFRPDGDSGRATASLKVKRTKEDPVAGSIICGVDDSESAKGAARVARGLSSRLGLGLVFVRVEDGSPDEKVSAIAERLQRVHGGVTEVDCGAGWSVEVGHPADRLVAAAEAANASLIVVGSTGPRSSMLGSVSAEVSRRAPCPVVVVPPGAEVSAPDWARDGKGDRRVSGGNARFGLSAPNEQADPDHAGGIVRFSLGSRGE